MYVMIFLPHYTWRRAILRIDLVCALWHTICDSNLHTNARRHQLIIGSRKEVPMESCKSTQVHLSRTLQTLASCALWWIDSMHGIKSVLSTSAIECLCLYLLTLLVGGPMWGWRCDMSAIQASSRQFDQREDTITQNARADSQKGDRSTAKQIATEVIQPSRCVGRKAEAMCTVRFMHDTASLLFSLVRASASSTAPHPHCMTA